MAPERRVGALSNVIVQDNKVPDVLDLKFHLVIEFIDVRLPDPVVGKHLHEADNAALNQMDAGGLQGLHETTGQTYGHAVLHPVLTPGAGLEFYRTGLGHHLALQIAAQLCLRLIPGPEFTAIHHAVTGAVLQGNAPLPTRFMGD